MHRAGRRLSVVPHGGLRPAGPPREAAAAEVHAAASAAGWEATGDEVARSLTILHFRRGKLSAFVALLESPRSTCGRQQVVDCSHVDSLQVTYS